MGDKADSSSQAAAEEEERPKRPSRVSAIQAMKAARRAEMEAGRKSSGAEPPELEDNRAGRSRQPTALVYDDRMLRHRCLWDDGHIENPERLRSVWERCRELGLDQDCWRLDSRPAGDEELRLHHSDRFVRVVRDSRTQAVGEIEKVCGSYDSVFMSAGTDTAARLAVGGAVDLTQVVLEGAAHNAMGLVRPPGHHAMEDELCGFCGFNNVVIAARRALDFGLSRVLIVDFDLHHGQGTQYAFYDDPRVLYMSVHRYEEAGFWPHLRESNFDHVGDFKGAGHNVNVPLNATGLGFSDYLAVFQQVFLPLAAEYQPQLVLVSAGYDSAMGCPEGEMLLSPTDYAHLVHSLAGLAGGRMVVLLEGGYCIPSLAESAAMTLRCLLGRPCPTPGRVAEPHASVLESIRAVLTALRPYWQCLQCRPVDPSQVLLQTRGRIPF